ncbi:glycosyltransferase [Rhodococcus daqingensis]|uniref:Glycosyltransferase n=1 Tax=Rhodococcus daqingensis TaxID=2479363 RepID=A0ABW2S4H5_9NOCA
MSRFLFVVPPLTGHINPSVAVGAALTQRGHDVSWVGHLEALTPLLPAHAAVFPVAHDVSGEALHALAGRWLQLRGTAELRFFWEEFLVPLAQQMLPAVEAAVDAFAPDVVVSDQQALAGALVARRAGLPWATSAITSSELVRPLAAMPKVEEWVTECMTSFQRVHGVADPVDLRWSEHLVLIYSTAALIGSVDSLPPHYALTGPVLTARPDTIPFPWEWLDPGRRTVLASLGTLNVGVGERFFRTLVDAVADEGDRLQLIIVAPPDMLESPPPHVLVRESVPQLSLLDHVDAVVTHAGHNTVCESLAHGLPLVVAPIRDDQPIVAQQVVDAGAGIRVKFARIRPPELREAVRAVLAEPSYRERARRIAESFASAGGAATAADRLEQLANGQPISAYR